MKDSKENDDDQRHQKVEEAEKKNQKMRKI